MKIAINPIQVFVSGKGLVTATQVEVRVSQHELGKGASGAYELQAEELAPPPAKEGTKKTTTFVSGTSALTAEQFAAWAADDAFFARAIVQNIGLTPKT